MLKFFFWILLLVNGVLFAWQQGYFESIFPSGREPARMAGQLNADKVKIVPPPEARQAEAPDAAAAASASSPAQEAAPAQAQPAQPSNAAPAPAVKPAPANGATSGAANGPAGAAPAPVQPVAAAAEKKPDLMACLEIGNFNPDDAKRFAAQIKKAGLDERLKERSVQEVASHLVYLPPQADKEGAEKKAGELRRLGITDFFIIQDNSPLRWGISLGVFKTEEAARNHLGTLVEKGVRTARVGQRSITANYFAYQFRELDAQKKWVIDKIKSGFPKQEERACEGA